MKPLAWILFIVMGVTSFSFATCRYLRTSYKLVSCAALSEPLPREISPTPSTENELPGLEESPLGPFVTIVCSCDYVLKGADPLCDQEQHQEFSTTEGTTELSTACRPGKSLCATRCPKNLP